MSITNKISYVDMMQDQRINNILSSLKLLNDEVKKTNEKVMLFKNEFVSLEQLKNVIDELNESLNIENTPRNNTQTPPPPPIAISIIDDLTKKMNDIDDINKNHKLTLEKIELDIQSIFTQIDSLRNEKRTIPTINIPKIKIKKINPEQQL
jgi:hypothetical protein